MKRFFLLLLVTFNCCASEKPLLALVMLVKNEAYSMEETAKSVLPYIDRYTILDTGSTDGTQEIARRTLAGIPGEIYEEPFVNFSVSRNRLLDLAGEKSVFVLTLNGDETLQNGAELRKFCEQYRNRQDASYLVERTDPSHSFFYSRRLIRTEKAPRFVGSTHEYLNDGGGIKVPGASIFHDPPPEENRIKQQYRWREDLKMLSAEYESDPENHRTIFYLAQTYDCLNEFEDAIKYYQKRASYEGWPEEKFITLIRIGEAYERWRTNKGKSQWPLAMDYFLEAYSYRPERVEPLIKIAQHYTNEGQHELAYIFLKRALDIPFPKDDILFVEKIYYDYTRFDLMGRVAWYIGEYEEGERAVRKALEVFPDMPHLNKNLEFYLNR